MSDLANILVVNDEPGLVNCVRAILEAGSYRVETVCNGTDAVERVRRHPSPELIFLDLLMPGMDGLQTLELLRRYRPEVPVIMLSCVNETGKVVEAMRRGADDYLTSPFHREALLAATERALSSKARSPRTSAPLAQVERPRDDSGFIAASPVTKRIYAEAKMVAQAGLPVLILGESGTGKEVLARHIHRFSPRASFPFLKVNCAAIPSELLESELFGYEVGAFTGATTAKPGKFELCNKGTILLDEIAEMHPHLQAKLLHVLQDQHFSRLGGRSETAVDVLIMATTNHDIDRAIAEGSFRLDLYYRLCAMQFKLPPLRDRREDIAPLIQHFQDVFATKLGREKAPLSEVFLEQCQRFSWPGNIRELENVVKRLLVLGEDRTLTELEQTARLEPAIDGPAAGLPMTNPMALKSLVHALKGKAENETIRKAMAQTNWNRRRAARLLGISYKALLYKLRQYNIDTSFLEPTSDPG